MQMTDAFRQFIRDHVADDPSELLLNASRYQTVDVKAAVVQIKARQQMKDKLPSWVLDDRLCFPSTLAAEQCSSERTAIYKQRLVQSDDWLCDLTGGLGVDTCYFSRKVRQVTYVERTEACCDTARSNFQALGIDNVHIINGDAVDLLANNEACIVGVNVFYIDPSRRGTDNKRLFALGDCEPDLMKIIALLHAVRCKLIVKLSPMLDISHLLSLIPNVREVHVVSVKNDCKELLIIVECLPTAFIPPPLTIYCLNYKSNDEEQSFRFNMQDERNALIPFAKNRGRYLYEPNVSILKAGGYKSIALEYNVEKLHVNSHLYTSIHLASTFPGRIFEIIEIIPFSSRTIKTLHKTIPQANITSRNFPLSAAELHSRAQITDGGNIYLFATTLFDDQKVLIKGRRL